MMLGLVLVAQGLGMFHGLELKVLDGLLRLRPAEPMDERILVVAIDEDDIQALGTYPIPDQVLADLLNRLDAHQPRAVGIDIFRDFVVQPGHDDLVATLEAMPQVIGIEKVLDYPIRPPAMLPPERVGFVDLPLDDDGFVRQVLLGTYGPTGDYHFALSLRLAERYLAAEGLSLENGLQDPVAMRFGATELTRFRRPEGGWKTDPTGNQILLNPRAGYHPFRRVTLRQVMANQVDPTWVRGAIVLIGITSLSVKDFVNSAAIASDNPGLVYGVDFHAHATSQIVSAVLEGRPLLREWPLGITYGWTVLWGLGGLGLALLAQRLWVSVVVVTAALGLLGLVAGLWLGVGLWVPVVSPALAFMLTSAITTSLRLAQTQQHILLSRRLLGQQTSPAIAQALWDGRQQLLQDGKLPAQMLTATILFSDICAFTSISEQQPPQQLLGWLNDYFMAMTEAVQDHQGVVNKFIGDGLMAVFGVPIARTSPLDIAADAERAVACALAMDQRLAQLNQQWQRQGLPPIRIRIGIFTGPVMVGSLGGRQRLEYGVVGDSVNTASRLESCAKHRQPTHCRILIAEETFQHLKTLNVPYAVEPWGEMPLRGKHKTVRVYRILSA
jgi:CHASE2 domain-containing sensor protein/class 3 adenylate cyclase